MTENLAGRGEGLKEAIEGALKEASVFCLACAKGEKVVVPPRSSIVGKAAVHSSGMICVPGTVRALIEERMAALEAAARLPAAPPEQLHEVWANKILKEYGIYAIPQALADFQAALATPSPQASRKCSCDPETGRRDPDCKVCVPGSPRKVGEDGALAKEIAADLEDAELVEPGLCGIKAMEIIARRLRSSSVAVGEQRQEEGV